MKNPRFGFIFSEFAPYCLDINEFEDDILYSNGCGYGETAREAIIDACKNYCDGRQLWDIQTQPTGYLVEFDEDGNVESIEKELPYIACETTYTVEFAEDDSEMFFKATN